MIQTGIIISRNDETIREYKKKVDQDKDREDVPKLESVEIVLVHCNLANNNYQQASKVLFIFVPSKQLLRLVKIVITQLGIYWAMNIFQSIIN